MDITQRFLAVALATGTAWIMYLLILCSMASFAIMLERVLYFRQFRGSFEDFLSTLVEKFAAKEPMEKISAWCSGQTLLEARVAYIGLERGTLQAALDAMDAASLCERTRMEKFLVVLGTLGNNTPFIGLFGTIIGIIQAFHALASGQMTSLDAGVSQTVMYSIAESLVSTALGILVALPAVAAYNAFGRAIKTRMSQVKTVIRLIVAHMHDENGSES